MTGGVAKEVAFLTSVEISDPGVEGRRNNYYYKIQWEQSSD